MTQKSMTKEEIEAGVLSTVTSRFLRLREGTSRRDLVVRFKNIEVLDNLLRQGILRRTNAGGPELYFPAAPAFQFCGDSDITRFARQGLTAVVHILRGMFEAESEKDNFTLEDLLNHARITFPDHIMDKDSLKLGLYLARDFNVLGGYTVNPDDTEITSFRISESVITIEDIDSLWDVVTARYKPVEGTSLNSIERTFAFEETVPMAFATVSGFDWSVIHPEVVNVSEKRFASSHFADSVEAALKAVNERVKKIVLEKTGNEYDGSDLMERAFSIRKPILLLGDLSTATGRSMQIGYMQIFAGSMTGIRNPKAHANIEIDATRAMHFLFLASLLMAKLDEATIAEATPSGVANTSVAVSKLNLVVSLSTEGTPPSQVLRLAANKLITVSQVEYMSSTEACIAAEGVSMHGLTVDVPVNDNLLLKLWNTPRSDRNTFDGSGPAKIAVTISDGGKTHHYILPVQLEAILIGSTMHRKLIGSRTFREG
jgi:uncharacterized protein (TIGR02391 family)